MDAAAVARQEVVVVVVIVGFQVGSSTARCCGTERHPHIHTHTHMTPTTQNARPRCLSASTAAAAAARRCVVASPSVWSFINLFDRRQRRRCLGLTSATTKRPTDRPRGNRRCAMLSAACACRSDDWASILRDHRRSCRF